MNSFHRPGIPLLIRLILSVYHSWVFQDCHDICYWSCIKPSLFSMSVLTFSDHQIISRLLVTWYESGMTIVLTFCLLKVFVPVKCGQLNCLTHWGWHKMATFCPHFQKHFHEQNWYIFIQISLKYAPKGLVDNEPALVKRNPITHPHGSAIGCLLCVFWWMDHAVAESHFMKLWHSFHLILTYPVSKVRKNIYRSGVQVTLELYNHHFRCLQVLYSK